MADSWEQPPLFIGESGFQWQFHVTLVPTRDDIILSTRVMNLPGWTQTKHQTDYKNQTMYGVRSVLVDIWDEIASKQEAHGLHLPVLEIVDENVTPF